MRSPENWCDLRAISGRKEVEDSSSACLLEGRLNSLQAGGGERLTHSAFRAIRANISFGCKQSYLFNNIYPRLGGSLALTRKLETPLLLSSHMHNIDATCFLASPLQ